MLVTAGPTEEPIDPVRVLTNTSSGKMGYAVARAAREAGAEVTLISGPVSLPTPPGRGARRRAHRAGDVRRGEEGREGRRRVHLRRRGRRLPREESVGAEDQESATATCRSSWRRTPTSSPGSPALPKPPFCVGFAAESENLAQNAKAKLAKKKLPLIVGNLAQDALGRDDNAITLYDANGEHPLGRGPKLELARKLVEHVAGKLPPRK